MDSYFCKLNEKLVTFVNNLTVPQPRGSTGSHDEQTEPETSRGKIRYNFANILWDISSHRGGKRQRSAPTSSTDQGVDHDTGGGKNDGGLSDVPEAVLADSIQPIFLQLQGLDAEELLSLTRVDTGGATLREG